MSQKKTKKITQVEFLKLEVFRLEKELLQKEIVINNMSKALADSKKETLQAKVQALQSEYLTAKIKNDNVISRDSNCNKKRLELIHSIQKRLKLKVSDNLGYDPETLDVNVSG